MISKAEVSASYRHVSLKILIELPGVLTNVSQELGKQKNQLKLSMENKVDNQESTIKSFNRQFLFNKEEKETAGWATPLEWGFTMFNIVITALLIFRLVA